MQDAETTDAPMGWIGAFEIAQIFIPGLRLENGVISPTCRGALDIMAYRSVKSYFS